MCRNNLARQTESEFNLFDKTEKQQAMSSLYQIKRLRRKSDIKGDIVISTIQELFAVLTGQALVEGNEDVEDEIAKEDEEKKSKEIISLGNDLKLAPDYFQFIIVDMAKEVFKGEFDNGEVPEHFVQKITYSSGDSNGLIRDLRTEKDFRIAVTVYSIVKVQIYIKVKKNDF